MENPWWHHPHVQQHLLKPAPARPRPAAPPAHPLPPRRDALHRSKIRFIVHLIVALFFVKVLLVAAVFQVAVETAKGSGAPSLEAAPTLRAKPALDAPPAALPAPAAASIL